MRGAGRKIPTGPNKKKFYFLRSVEGHTFPLKKFLKFNRLKIYEHQPIRKTPENTENDVFTIFVSFFQFLFLIKEGKKKRVLVGLRVFLCSFFILKIYFSYTNIDV